MATVRLNSPTDGHPMTDMRPVLALLAAVGILGLAILLLVLVSVYFQSLV